VVPQYVLYRIDNSVLNRNVSVEQGKVFPRSTDIIKFLMNCQPIKDILSYHRIAIFYTSGQKERKGFEKNIFKCVTLPDLSGVPLNGKNDHGS